MLDPNLNPDLKFRILEAPFIIKNYVNGEDKCNYEFYLTELLNNSKWIKQIHTEKFEWKEEQSNGECDACSGDYGIDFKLIASKTKLQAKSICSMIVTRFADGGILYSAHNEVRSVQSTRLNAALRNKSPKELEKIRNSEIKKYGVENDIITFLKTLEKNKDLLLFYPYVFFFEKKDYKNGKEIVVESLQYDFGQAMLYRSQKVPDKDTLFLTIYSTDFILMNVEDGKFVLVETISTSKCETFEYLKMYSDIWR